MQRWHHDDLAGRLYRLFGEGEGDKFEIINYPAIATHHEVMLDATVAYHQKGGIGKETFEFQMLHGVRRDLQRQLVGDGFNVRVYIPFGSHWYPYLMRRLAERPANMLFMAGSVVKESPLGFLWPGRKNGSKS